MGFSRQAYWSGLPSPSPGDLSNPGIEPQSPALQAGSLLTELWGKPNSLGFPCNSLASPKCSLYTFHIPTFLRCSRNSLAFPSLQEDWKCRERLQTIVVGVSRQMSGHLLIVWCNFEVCFSLSEGPWRFESLLSITKISSLLHPSAPTHNSSPDHLSNKLFTIHTQSFSLRGIQSKIIVFNFWSFKN